MMNKRTTDSNLNAHLLSKCVDRIVELYKLFGATATHYCFSDYDSFDEFTIITYGKAPNTSTITVPIMDNGKERRFIFATDHETLVISGRTVTYNYFTCMGELALNKYNDEENENER